MDDDADGYSCNDSDCANDPACRGWGEICTDGGDNDGGDIDCDDSDCASDPCCDLSNPLLPFIECDCADGIDNNGDEILTVPINVRDRSGLYGGGSGSGETNCTDGLDMMLMVLWIAMIRIAVLIRLFDHWKRDMR